MNNIPKKFHEIIYIALPETITVGDKTVTINTPKIEYGLHETELSAVKAFLKMNYGSKFLIGKTETELRNAFYKSGYILKKRP